MENRQNPPIRLLLVCFACLLGVAAVLFAIRQGTRQNTPAGATDGSAAPVNHGSAGPERTPGKRPRPAGGTPTTSASDAVAALVGDSALSNPELIAGLRRIVDDAGRPIADRLEALDHALNLIPDDNPAVLREMASRRVLPEEVRMRLLADAFNRPVRLQGEILLSLLENAAGDTRKTLLTELASLCGEDLGDDPAAWRKAVEKLTVDP